MASRISRMYLFKKALSLGLSNIWRNRLISLITIFVIGILIFIFNVILAINFIAKDSISTLNKKVDLIIYLKETTNVSEAQSIIQDLKTLPGIENIKYTSKEEALTQIKTLYPNLSLAFEKYDLGNPLPASIDITTNHPNYHGSISQFLGQDKYQPYLSNTSRQNDEQNAGIMSSVSSNLIKLSDFTEQVIFWLIMTFVVGGALITLNAFQITIFARREEIEIMKMVGASYLFIRLPFIVEGIIFGTASVVISILMLMIVSQNINISNISLLDYSDSRFYLILLFELVVTTILAVFSSMIAVHEYLYKRSLQ